MGSASWHESPTPSQHRGTAWPTICKTREQECVRGWRLLVLKRSVPKSQRTLPVILFALMIPDELHASLDAPRYAVMLLIFTNSLVIPQLSASSSLELVKLRYAVQAIPIVLTKGIWN